MKLKNKKIIYIFTSISLAIVVLIGTLLLFNPVKNKENSEISSSTIKDTTQIIDNQETENNNENNADNTTSDTPQTDVTIDNTIEETDKEINEEKNNNKNNSTNEENKNNQIIDRPIVNEEVVSKPDEDNEKTNGSSSITIVTPSKKDDSIFVAYSSFLSAVEKNENSFNGKPQLGNCKSSCDCGLEFSGDFAEGTLKFSGKDHSHRWNLKNKTFMSNYNGITSASQYNSFPNNDSMHCDCDGCELVVGKRYIYVKLEEKDHGHGWIWTEEESLSFAPTPNKTEFECGCALYGHFIRGSVHISDEHGHVWTYTETDDASNSSVSQNNILEECKECGFKRWISKDGIQYIEFTCKVNNKKHILTYN